MKMQSLPANRNSARPSRPATRSANSVTKPSQRGAKAEPTIEDAEPLTVTLDAEASHVVRSWAEILARDPRDVASALVVHVHKGTLERYLAHKAETSIRATPEDAEDLTEAVTEAASRRKRASAFIRQEKGAYQC